jgi:two-component system cell cycle sensor histidine kinase/response regulator CckA
LLMLPPEERADETIETMRDAAQRGGRLTRQLLALGQRNVAAPRIVDVNALIRSNESLLTRSLRENIALRLELSPQAGCIEIDPNEFEQSLLNLVLNARDAIAGHGTLSIATGVQMRATGAEAKAEQPYVLVEIHDTGIGMSPDTIEHIFEPFFTTKETGKGTGLGLSCVYSIVRQAGGAIEVESEPGVGTWFRLYFPQRASAVAHALSSDDETSVVGGTETVLVVEDDAAVRSTAALVLESYGYRVLCAADPQEALTVARRIQDIDLVLSDVVMPQMSGVELAGELAKLRPGTPVLFMSGYAQAAIEEEGLLDVARRLVQKPFTAHELALQVRKALDDALHMPTAGVDAGHH